MHSSQGRPLRELISDFYSQQQKKNELEDVFVDEANEQLKHQYANKLHDQ